MYKLSFTAERKFLNGSTGSDMLQSELIYWHRCRWTYLSMGSDILQSELIYWPGCRWTYLRLGNVHPATPCIVQQFHQIKVY